MTLQNEFNLTLAMVKGFVPEFNWCWKSDKWYHRAIGFLFDKLGMTGYMKNFYTTFRYTVGRPSNALNNGVPNEFEIFMHEGQHSVDAKHITFPLFALAYMFPQWLGLLAVPLAILLVLLTHSWLGLLGLLALGFFAPLPSPGRVWAELRGYRVSLSVIYWFSGIPANLEAAYIQEFLTYFTSSSYYFMGTWPFKVYIQKKLEGYLAELKAGKGFETSYLTAVRNLALQLKTQDQ